MALNPLEMLRRDEATLIPCAGGCGFKLTPYGNNLCNLCDPDAPMLDPNPPQHVNCVAWPEEVVNEQDEAEEAGQEPLFPYSEKDPLE